MDSTQLWLDAMTDDDKTFFETLGSRIATLRKEQGMTQTQLGELLGISQQHVASFEKGRRRVPVSALPTLAKSLGAPVESLLGSAPKPNKRGPAPKLQQQMQRIGELPRAKQRFVIEMLDAVLASAAGGQT